MKLAALDAEVEALSQVQQHLVDSHATHLRSTAVRMRDMEDEIERHTRTRQ